MKLVVIGNGMVGQRLLEAVRQRDPDARWQVTVLAEEGRPAYDRVRLSAYFDGVSTAELTYGTPSDVDLRLGEPATAVDVKARRGDTAGARHPHHPPGPPPRPHPRLAPRAGPPPP